MIPEVGKIYYEIRGVTKITVVDIGTVVVVYDEDHWLHGKTKGQSILLDEFFEKYVGSFKEKEIISARSEVEQYEQALDNVRWKLEKAKDRLAELLKGS